MQFRNNRPSSVCIEQIRKYTLPHCLFHVRWNTNYEEFDRRCAEQYQIRMSVINMININSEETKLEETDPRKHH